MKKESIGYVVLFSFITCAIFVAGLAGANQATKARVEANRRFATQAAVLDTLGVSYTTQEEAAARFAELVQPVEGAVPQAYRATVHGTPYVVVEHAGAALWGTVTIILAADATGSEVRGIRILSQNETPGLGGRIEEPPFLAQFAGERVEDGKVRVRTGAEAGGGFDNDKANARVDGITGATRTSVAFEAIVAGALARVREIGGGSR